MVSVTSITLEEDSWSCGTPYADWDHTPTMQPKVKKYESIIHILLHCLVMLGVIYIYIWPGLPAAQFPNMHVLMSEKQNLLS